MRKTFSDLTKKYKDYHFFYVGYLSNWYLSPFVDLSTGIAYNCSEQFMMHKKALLFGDDAIASKVLAVQNPLDQKNLGKAVSNFDQAVWDREARPIVYEGCYYKFTQNKGILKQLMSTRGTLLVEASAVDKVWGIGMRSTDFGADDPEYWKGKNWLGQVLTHLRDDLDN